MAAQLWAAVAVLWLCGALLQDSPHTARAADHHARVGDAASMLHRRHPRHTAAAAGTKHSLFIGHHNTTTTTTTHPAATPVGPEVPMLSARWVLEHRSQLDAGMFGVVPQRRYGGPMVAVGGRSLVVLSGYQFDHARARPVWMGDVWVFHPSPPLGRLERQESIGAGEQHAGSSANNPLLGAAHSDPRNASSADHEVEHRKFQGGLWRRKRVGGFVPPPAYKQMAAAVEELVVVFGGDDGGYHSGASSFVWGSFFNTLYVLSTNTWRWRRLRQVGAPSPRQGGTLSAVGTYLVLFGGLARDPAEDRGPFPPPPPPPSGPLITETNGVFLIPMSALAGRPARVAWQDCVSADGSAAQRPAPRRAHAAVSYGGALYIFGGYAASAPVPTTAKARRAAAEPTQHNFNDLWRLTVTPYGTCAWEELARDAAGGAGPVGRGALAMTALDGAIVITGGATCAGPCVCHHDTWAFNISARTWTVLPTPDDHTPVGRHLAGYATLRDRLFIFGGEGYAPYAYWNDVWSLPLAVAHHDRPGFGGQTAPTAAAAVAGTPILAPRKGGGVKGGGRRGALVTNVPSRFPSSTGGSALPLPLPLPLPMPLGSVLLETMAGIYTVRNTANITNLMVRTRDEEEDPSFPAAAADNDALLQGVYFGGPDELEVNHATVTALLLVPLVAAFMALAALCFLSHRQRNLWRKQQK